MRNQCRECFQWFQSLLETNLCQNCGGEKEVLTPPEQEPEETEGDLLDEILNQR